jgi:predicted mannosyl-3-phosphoglycerate phosphatase (HAD superfamily)
MTEETTNQEVVEPTEPKEVAPQKDISVKEVVDALNQNFSIISQGVEEFGKNLAGAMDIIKADIQLLLNTIDAQANKLKEVCSCECHDEAGETIEAEVVGVEEATDVEVVEAEVTEE